MPKPKQAAIQVNEIDELSAILARLCVGVDKRLDEFTVFEAIREYIITNDLSMDNAQKLGKLISKQLYHPEKEPLH